MMRRDAAERLLRLAATEQRRRSDFVGARLARLVACYCMCGCIPRASSAGSVIASPSLRFVGGCAAYFLLLTFCFARPATQVAFCQRTHMRLSSFGSRRGGRSPISAHQRYPVLS